MNSRDQYREAYRQMRISSSNNSSYVSYEYYCIAMGCDQRAINNAHTSLCRRSRQDPIGARYRFIYRHGDIRTKSIENERLYLRWLYAYTRYAFMRMAAEEELERRTR